MADIFNRRPLQFGGAFAADAASISFTTGNPAFQSGVGLVTQTIQISYQQPITRLYEVGTQLTYYIAGRPQGQLGMARVLGPGIVTATFYQSFGDVCFANKNHLVFDVAAGCAPTGALVSSRIFFLLNNILLQSIGLSVAAQDMIINEQLSMMFISLEGFDNSTDLYNAVCSTYPTDSECVG